MAQKQWTDEIPTTSGIYEWRLGPTGRVYLIEVKVSGGELRVEILSENALSTACILSSAGQWRYVMPLEATHAAVN